MSWTKWTYVCTNCDALVEMTLRSDGKSHFADCPKCFDFNLTLLSVVDATIPVKEMES